MSRGAPATDGRGLRARRGHRVALGAVAAIAGLASLAGCTDDASKASTSTVAATSTLPPGVTTTIFDPATLPPMPGGDVECGQFSEFLNTLSASAVTSKSAPTDTDQVKQFRADLPTALQPDFDTLITTYASITDSATEAPGKISQKLNTPEMQAASGRLGLYLERGCGGGG